MVDEIGDLPLTVIFFFLCQLPSYERQSLATEIIAQDREFFLTLRVFDVRNLFREPIARFGQVVHLRNTIIRMTELRNVCE